MKDAHNLDHIVSAHPVEDEVRANGEFEVSGANVVRAAARDGAARKAVEAFSEQPHISVGLSLVPALGRIGPDAGKVAARGGGEADLHLLPGRLAHRGEEGVGFELLKVAAGLAFIECGP